MASLDRTAYPHFKPNPTDKELAQFYTPTEAELELAGKHARGARPLFCFLILLKSFQRLGYFPSLRNVPQPIKEHLRLFLGIAPEQLENLAVSYHSKSLYRYHTAIRAYLKVKIYDEQAQFIATKAVREAAQTKSNPADLINVALEILVKERYELPAFSTLDHLVQRLRAMVNLQYCDQVATRLPIPVRQLLDAMLTPPKPPKEQASATANVSPTPVPAAADATVTQTEVALNEGTEWTKLKEMPKRASLTHLQELQERYSWLWGLPDPYQFLAGLPPGKIKDFAAQGQPLKANELLRYTPARRYTLLLCLIQQARVSTRDSLIETFLKRMAFFQAHAKAELEEIRQRQRATSERLLGVLAEILLTGKQLAVDHPEDQEQLQAVFGKLTWQLLIQRGGNETLLGECEALAAYNDNNYLPLLYRYYKSHRATLFQLVKSLKFVATSEDKTLKAALDFLLQHEDSSEEYLPYQTLDLSFAKEAWQQLVVVKQQAELKFSRRQLEVCIFFHLATDLKNGDMAVTDSEKYGDYRQQLLSWPDCQSLLVEYSSQVELPVEAKALVAHLKAELVKKSIEVDAAYPTNSQFSLDEKGTPSVHRMPAKTYSKNLKKLEAVLREKMPARSVLEILGNVQHYTDFTRHFGPPSGNDTKLEKPVERYLLTTFCYGCNLGPSQLVKHLQQEVTAQQLAFANYRHIDNNRLLSARTDIINSYVHFDLPKLWGDGSRVAADGTKVELARNNLVSEYHIRYGGYGGIRYHFVSDNYLALFTSFITCGVWEGSYILDVFSKNQSELQPDTVFSDTHGQALTIFGLAFLLGIKLHPRIRNFKDLIFYRPAKNSHYQHLDQLFTGVIDWELIERHVPDLLQVALSIRTGKILPSTLLRRLNNYSNKNKLYLAMRELGRVVRTIFLLRWLIDGEMRVEVSANTNKVEAYHNFAGWLSFGGEGLLNENDPEEQEKRNQYLDLVADTVIYQNVVDMSRVLGQLVKEGLEFTQQDLEALSPYLTHHIKRFGDYVLDLSRVPAPWDGKLELPKSNPNPKTNS